MSGKQDDRSQAHWPRPHHKMTANCFQVLSFLICCYYYQELMLPHTFTFLQHAVFLKWWPWTSVLHWPWLFISPAFSGPGLQELTTTGVDEKDHTGCSENCHQTLHNRVNYRSNGPRRAVRGERTPPWTAQRRRRVHCWEKQIYLAK